MEGGREPVKERRRVSLPELGAPRRRMRRGLEMDGGVCSWDIVGRENDMVRKVEEVEGAVGGSSLGEVWGQDAGIGPHRMAGRVRGRAAGT